MRIQGHLIYLALLAAVTAAWLSERSGSSELPLLLPAQEQNKPAALPTANAQEVPTPIAEESTEQNQSQPRDTLVQAKTADSADTAEITSSAQMQQLLTRRIADTASIFEQEDYHRDWSFESRQRISDLFIVHAKELENFSVADIECKRSVCRIQSEISGEHFMQIMELQRLLNEQSWFGSPGETVFSANDNNQPHEIYLRFGK